MNAPLAPTGSLPPTREEIIARLGPLGTLAGTWEGIEGDDTAPNDSRNGPEKNLFREKLTFEPFGPVNNHEQELYGLRYSTTAWRHGEGNAFHEETGYWLWDGKTGEVLRCFVVPRGITVLAGGKARATDKTFCLSATVGSNTYGIASAEFLNREFKTVRYDLKVTVHGPDSFTYEEDTQIEMPGKGEIFHHIDKNKMKRVGP